MGQKISPLGLRLGVIRGWDSRWYAKGRKYAETILDDHKLRLYIKNKLKHAGVAQIEIERTAAQIKVIISTARPGVVIGKKGVGIDALTEDVQKQVSTGKVVLNINEIRKPDLNAQLVAENLALQLEKRVSWRRAVKKAIVASVRQGVRGIKIRIAGRLGGAEIARAEWYNEKSIPLHTLRANVDYAHVTALTTYGIIGLKVWIYHGEIYTMKKHTGVSNAQP